MLTVMAPEKKIKTTKMILIEKIRAAKIFNRIPSSAWKNLPPGANDIKLFCP
jgi:hypothetical protein